jgi:Family of unknown function (DUF6114)
VSSAFSGNGGSGGYIPAEPSGSAPAGRAGSAWQAWQGWRRTRPFWGGLLVVLAGAEILLSEKAPLPLIIHIGLQGLAGYLIPAVMVLCGVLLLFHPIQRTFYSVLAVLLALGSWITSNLGGFFVGMVIGLIGGSLAFAWQQRGQRYPGKRRRGRRPQDPASVGLALIRDHQAGAGSAGPAKGEGSGTGAGSAGTQAVLAIPLAALALSMLVTAPLSRPASGAQLAALAAVSSPKPVAMSHTPRSPVPASPSPTPTPSASPTVSRAPSPRPSAAASPTPTGKRTHREAATGAPAWHASGESAQLTAGSAVLAGLSFDGIARVPTRSGVRRMLKLGMSSLTLSGGTVLLVRQQGETFATREPSLGLRGNVVLYVTRIAGNRGGTRLSFTPGRPPSWHLADVTLTGLVADQPCTTADELDASGFRASQGPASSPEAGG